MISNINEDRKVIWKDKRRFDIFVSLSVLIIILLLVGIIYFIYGLFEKLFFGILLVASLIFFFLRLQRRFLLVTNKSIKLGNVTFKKFASSEKKQDSLFLGWDDIDTISLSNKVKIGPFGGLIFTYLLIHIKNNKKYECVIYDPKGFLLVLKKLNKSYLLKDKKRLYKKYGIK